MVPSAPSRPRLPAALSPSGERWWSSVACLATLAGQSPLLGIGPVLLLLFNGVMIGAVAGHLLVAGMGATFLPFVAGHGAFELPAIVIAGVAGLRIGIAVIAPGRYRRSESLRRAAHRVLILVAGFAFMFLLAAFVEAFWSSSVTVPGAFRLGVGGLLWALVLAWLGLGGRRHGA